MAVPPAGAMVEDEVIAVVDASGRPACPCGGDMWFLQFGYESWVCRRNTRHWFQPRADRWSLDATALAGDG
jgi:hypothetical protein